MDFAELSAIEKKWQNKWQKAKAFEPKTKGKKFFLTVPYPYASGPMHVGHGRTHTVADFMARYKRKVGFNVLWPSAFHISGTPILAISRAIAAGDQKAIDLYRSYVSLYQKVGIEKVVEGFKDPQKAADYFASLVESDFNKFGYSIDWTRKFNTGEPIYNKFVEWQYWRMREKGVVTQGSYPILYSPEMQNAVGEDDIRDGDTDPVDLQEFSVVKFKMGRTVLPAATLRPETVFGVTNIWINPEGHYVKAKIGEETWIISKEALGKLIYQKEGVLETERVEPNNLIGLEVEILGRKVPILPASFVDTDHGTGIVYSVPAHAPYDYAGLMDVHRSGRALEIQPIRIIDIEGYSDHPAKIACEHFRVESQKDADKLDKATQKIYKDEFYKGVLNKACGEFAGLKINEVKDNVKKWLANQALADRFYETSRKAVTRDGGRVIGAVLKDQWFLDYTSREWKEKTKKLIEKMDVYPEKYRQVLLDTIDWLEKRPCARRRGLGTRMPWDKDWVIESLSDSTIYMAFYTIAHIIRKKKISAERLTPEVFDHIFLGKGAAASVAKSNKIPAAALKEMRKDFDFWYPLDQRHTAPAHLSNHLSFYLLHHTLLFPPAKWPRIQTLNEMLLVEGQKMSKSKGNVIPLLEISKKHGADTYRLYTLTANDIESTMDWKEADVSSVRNRLFQFGELMKAVAKAKKVIPKDGPDRWMAGRFYHRLAKAKALAESYKLRGYAIEVFYEVMNDIGYYTRRVGEKRALSIIRGFAEDWLVALEPIIPHMAEEFWERLGKKGFVSLAKWPAKRIKTDVKIELGEQLIQKILDDVKEIKKIARLERLQKITLFLAPDWKRLVYKMVRDKKQMKEIIEVVGPQNGETAKYVVYLQKKGQLPEGLGVTEEKKVIQTAGEFLEKEFGAPVRISEDQHPKAKSADVMKPGILLE